LGEVKNALFDVKYEGLLHSGVFGLGGRNIFIEDIEDLFNKALDGKLEKSFYVGLRE